LGKSRERDTEIDAVVRREKREIQEKREYQSGEIITETGIMLVKRKQVCADPRRNDVYS
jgi:hypothetical protein